MTVRLACLSHAASIHPEPGSNSQRNAHPCGYDFIALATFRSASAQLIISDLGELLVRASHCDNNDWSPCLAVSITLSKFLGRSFPSRSREVFHTRLPAWYVCRFFVSSDRFRRKRNESSSYPQRRATEARRPVYGEKIYLSRPPYSPAETSPKSIEKPPKWRLLQR